MDGRDALLGSVESESSVAAHLTAEANGMTSGFFRSLKKECVCRHKFGDFAEARAAIPSQIHWYNAERLHQSLGYRSPRQFRGLQHQTCGVMARQVHYTRDLAGRLSSPWGSLIVLGKP